MNILIIGGLGYIGSTLLGHLQSTQKYGVTVLDILDFEVDPTYFHRIFSDGRFRFIKGDVADMRLTWNLIKNHDVVVYMASLTMPETARRPEDGMFVNQYMAEIVGDCCAKLGKGMVFLSTCSNYGKSEKPVDEDSELLPVSMYARTKVDAENYLLRNVPGITILRCATAYGVGAGRTRWDVLLNDFVGRALSNGVVDVFQPDACRPICHVEDIASAIGLAVSKAPRDEKSVYNVGSNSQNFTKRELAEVVCKHTDAEITITQSIDNRDYRVDFSKVGRDLGFEAKHTPESTLPSLVAKWKSLAKGKK